MSTDHAAIARCSACRYFHDGLTVVATSCDEAGECRRFPPSARQDDSVDSGWRVWPAVYDADWCGAFEPADDLRRRRPGR